MFTKIYKTTAIRSPKCLMCGDTIHGVHVGVDLPNNPRRHAHSDCLCKMWKASAVNTSTYSDWSSRNCIDYSISFLIPTFEVVYFLTCYKGGKVYNAFKDGYRLVKFDDVKNNESISHAVKRSIEYGYAVKVNGVTVSSWQEYKRYTHEV